MTTGVATGPAHVLTRSPKLLAQCLDQPSKQFTAYIASRKKSDPLYGPLVVVKPQEFSQFPNWAFFLGGKSFISVHPRTPCRFPAHVITGCEVIGGTDGSDTKSTNEPCTCEARLRSMQGQRRFLNCGQRPVEVFSTTI